MSLPAAGSKALVGVRFARALQLRRRRQRAVLAYRSTALFLEASAREIIDLEVSSVPSLQG